MCEAICIKHLHSECALCDDAYWAAEVKRTERKGFIYLLTNLLNGKRYIGQYVGDKVERRWSSHIRAALAGSKYAVHCAIRKYGTENFSAEVIWHGLAARLDAKEIYYVAKFNTFVGDVGHHGYNMTRGGNGGQLGSSYWLGRHHTAETRMKISLTFTPERRAALSAAHTGRLHTKEHRHKISMAKQGHSVSTQTRTKISSTLISGGYSAWNKGRSWTTEARTRISAGMTAAHAADPTLRENAARACRGKKRPPRSEEWCAKISKARLAGEAKKRALKGLL